MIVIICLVFGALGLICKFVLPQRMQSRNWKGGDYWVTPR